MLDPYEQGKPLHNMNRGELYAEIDRLKQEAWARTVETCDRLAESAKAIAAERERCAKIAEGFGQRAGLLGRILEQNRCRRIAAAIRGNADAAT